MSGSRSLSCPGKNVILSMAQFQTLTVSEAAISRGEGGGARRRCLRGVRVLLWRDRYVNHTDRSQSLRPSFHPRQSPLGEHVLAFLGDKLEDKNDVEALGYRTTIQNRTPSK